VRKIAIARLPVSAEFRRNRRSAKILVIRGPVWSIRDAMAHNIVHALIPQID